MRVEKRIPFSFLHGIVMIAWLLKIRYIRHACTKMLYLEIKYKSILSTLSG